MPGQVLTPRLTTRTLSRKVAGRQQLFPLCRRENPAPDTKSQDRALPVGGRAGSEPRWSARRWSLLLDHLRKAQKAGCWALGEALPWRVHADDPKR